MITIINYGLGNLGSIGNMLKHIGEPYEIVSDADLLMKSNKILLPGVGAFDAAMSKIKHLGLEPILKVKALEEKVPFLGICLGMQLLTDYSEEGNLPGLGLIQGKTIRFNFSNNTLKVPHMGWNIVNLKKDSLLTVRMEGEQRFYFAHSYHVECFNEKDVVGQTSYGYAFDSIVQSGNIFGGQFHPEKSHRFGMQLLKNFAMI